MILLIQCTLCHLMTKGETSMAASILSIRVEPEVKQSFVDLCEKLGLTASAAVNMFMRQMLREKGLPFKPSLHMEDEREEALNSSGEEIGELASAVGKIAAQYPQISSVILFGSYARGEAGLDSDIDLRVTYDRESTFGLLGMASFSAAVGEATGRSIDVVSAEALDDDLASAIERDGVLLYERA